MSLFGNKFGQKNRTDQKQIWCDCKSYEVVLNDTIMKLPLDARNTVLQIAVDSDASKLILPYLPDKYQQLTSTAPINGKIMCYSSFIIEGTVTLLKESDACAYFEKLYGGYIPFSITRLEKYKPLGATTHLNIIFGCGSAIYCTISLISLSQEFRGKQLFPFGLLSAKEKHDFGLVL